MDKSEVVPLIRELLSETRSYHGTSFPSFADSSEALAYYTGLLRALPDSERTIVTAAYEKILHSQ